MKSMITAITPTGDRPLAFELCQQWMANQTRQPDQWLVIDDGKVAMELEQPLPMMQYVRREPQIDDPKHTLILNMQIALPLITGNKVIVIEDDDYYAPSYIEEMSNRLDQHEIVGIMRAKYYHLPSGGYFQCDNTTHASLAETGFRVSVTPEFSEIWDGNGGSSLLDFRLWHKVGRARGLLFIDIDNPLYLSIKGLPGRTGIGGGHTSDFYGSTNKDTADRAILRKWVPRDHQTYLNVIENMK